jgi:hypothetical protein
MKMSVTRLPIIILVSAIKTSPGRFKAWLNSTDALLVSSSRQPFMDSARTLLEKGYDPTVTLEMMHAGSNVVALRARLGKAARLSVEEGVNGPRFVPFRNGLKSCVDAPPIAFGTMAATHTLAEGARISEPSTQPDDDGAVETLSVRQKRTPTDPPVRRGKTGRGGS